MAASSLDIDSAEMSDAQNARVLQSLEKLQKEQDRILAQMRWAQRMIARQARTMIEPLWDARQALVAGKATAAATNTAAEEAKSVSLGGFTFTAEDAAAADEAATEAAKAGEEDVAADAAEDDGEPEVLAPFKEFWITVLTNHPLWEHLIEDDDQDALEYLVDCRVTSHEDWKGLTMTWTFRENPYFTNTTLTKTVKFSAEMDTTDNVGVKMVEGCEIAWKEGKRLTKKSTKPKGGGRKRRGGRGGRGGGGGGEPKPSVFDYFERSINPSEVAARGLGPEELEEIHDQVSMDIQAVEVVREALCPRAVKWLTGEDNADDSDDEDGVFLHEEGDEEEEEEEEEEEGAGGPVDAAAVQAALAAAFDADSSSGTGANPFAPAADGANPFAPTGANPFAAPGTGGEDGATGESSAEGTPAAECKQQ